MTYKDTEAKSSVFLSNSFNDFDKSVCAKYIEKDDSGDLIQEILLVTCPTGYVKNAAGICVESCNPDTLKLFDTKSISGECTPCA